jgi:GNAT superfamily N-acetyltransferase
VSDTYGSSGVAVSRFMILREPGDSDSADIARLLGQLGYPSTPQEVAARLAVLRADAPATVMWVAELDGAVVGVATAREFPGIHISTPVTWLTVLVVDERVRGRGIGRRLVREAEEWARSRGAARLSLTSAVHRKEAHQFYINLGYQQTGVRLSKLF